MKLIELHVLQSVPSSCLNRDDVGSPKTGFFGGVSRSRISSQCWKRAVREYLRQQDQTANFRGKRTRYLVDQFRTLLMKKGCTKDEAKEAALDMGVELFGKNEMEVPSEDKKKKKKASLKSAKEEQEIGKLLQTKTLFYFTPLEQDTLVTSAVSALAAGEDVAKAVKKAKKVLTLKDGADLALMGRMIASDPSLTVDGAAQFTHPLSTHKGATELDFFSAVDEELPDYDSGAAHLGVVEFSSACFYRYINVNVDVLRDNKHLSMLKAEDFRHVLESFLRACLEAVPGARKNSMFGWTRPDFVLGLARTGQPLTLVNAFEVPVVANGEGFVAPSVKKLLNYKEYFFTTYEIPLAKESRIPDKAITPFIQELLDATLGVE